MRWQGQTVAVAGASSPQLVAGDGPAPLPGLELAGLVRSVRPPGFGGMTFHEVLCRSALNRVPAQSALPFRWTVNPMRGCTHACKYCFARGSHEYLELDPGTGFDSEIVVKTNVAAVLRKELARRSWQREPVALGTNTDPYQRAEGRYQLMPAIIDAFAETGTPFSILTKGTLLRRDLPVLVRAARLVPVTIGVSLALADERLQQALEPGTPGPRARLELIRVLSEAGFAVNVMVAPVIPYLTDGQTQLEELFREISAAGTATAVVLPMHLRGATRGWFLAWLQAQNPGLMPRYRQLYGRGGYVSAQYRSWLRARTDPLIDRYGLRPQAQWRETAQPHEGSPAPRPPTLFG